MVIREVTLSASMDNGRERGNARGASHGHYTKHETMTAVGGLQGMNASTPTLWRAGNHRGRRAHPGQT